MKKTLTTTTTTTTIYFAATAKTLGGAKRLALGCDKAHTIVMGDDSTFWIVTFKQARQLIAAGYEEVSSIG